MLFFVLRLIESIQQPPGPLSFWRAGQNAVKMMCVPIAPVPAAAEKAA